MIRNARKNKSLKNCEEAKGDSEKMWKVVREATNTKPKPNTTMAVLSDGWQSCGQTTFN